MTPIGTVQPLGRRRHLLAVLMAAPTITAALGLGALDVWRSYRPNSPLFVTPIVGSLADAIARDDVLRAYEFIRAGQDPNDAITVRHPVLTGGRWVRVAPLLWAFATESKETLPMLLGFGAHLDATMERRVMICLAEQLGHHEVAQVLEVYGGADTPEPCPAREAIAEVLLASDASRTSPIR